MVEMGSVIAQDRRVGDRCMVILSMASVRTVQ